MRAALSSRARDRRALASARLCPILSPQDLLPQIPVGGTIRKVGSARLPEPSCQGSIVRLTSIPLFRKNRILLACPASPEARDHLTVRVSYDECTSWPLSKVLCSGPAKYSDLAVTTDGRILCLYEADGNGKLTLARFNIEWLTDGQDSLASN